MESTKEPELTGKARRKDMKLRFQPASLIADAESDARLDVATVSVTIFS